MLSSSFDLRTHTTAVIGSGRGVTEVEQITGNVVVGDNFAPNSFAFVARVDNGDFTYLTSLGGLNSTARQVNHHGVVAGGAALPPTDPVSANGPFHAAVWVPHTAGQRTQAARPPPPVTVSGRDYGSWHAGSRRRTPCRPVPA